MGQLMILNFTATTPVRPFELISTRYLVEGADFVASSQLRPLGEMNCYSGQNRNEAKCHDTNLVASDEGLLSPFLHFSFLFFSSLLPTLHPIFPTLGCSRPA
jgi:hypothetical protein